MILSKQLFQDKFEVNFDVSKASLAQCIQYGPFVHFAHSGVPLSLAIGCKIINAIERLCLETAENLGYNMISMPNLIPTSTLDSGEPIHDGFLDQFIFLSDRMKHFHLLSTPEPFFIELIRNGLNSYRQLPMRTIFTSHFYRQLRDVDGFLKSREFKMLAGLSLHDEQSTEIEAEKFKALMKRIQIAFSLDLEVLRDQQNNYTEYFYLHNEGCDVFKNNTAISLAMFYQYSKQKQTKGRYRNHQNQNSRADIITFGLGLQRLFFVILDNFRDSYGFNLPKSVRPFELSVIPSRKQYNEHAKHIYQKLQTNYSGKVVLDDRLATTASKCRLANFLGIPQRLIVKGDSSILEARGLGKKKKIISSNDNILHHLSMAD